jgi:DNA-nicking Smr family endonuclease
MRKLRAAGPKSRNKGRGRLFSRSLRDQLRALTLQPAEPAPSPPAPSPPPSFRDLAADVSPLPAAPKRYAAPAPTRGVRPVPRAPTLWVEVRDEDVRALAPGAPARLLSDLSAGKVVPRRQLDLHRLSATNARLKLTAFVQQARCDGIMCVLVVCGRGQHSGRAGPVLPSVTAEHLAEALAAQVLAFATAPRRWGGVGALVVVLKPAEPPG